MIAPERVVELARKLGPDGVPAYVYDLTALDAHAAAIRAALPRGVQFYYAVKANPDAAVLRTLARHADGFEVSSGGELAYCVDSAKPRRLPFELERIMRTEYIIDRYQENYFVIDSFDQLMRETAPDFTPLYQKLGS